MFISRFIEKYGTHVVVGIKMGGKDTIYAKQQHSSTLQPSDLQKKLKDMADKVFIDESGPNRMNTEKEKVRSILEFIKLLFSFVFPLILRVPFKQFHIFE